MDTHDSNAIVSLASEMIALDTRSSNSNLAIMEMIEHHLGGFEIERLNFKDPAGIDKAALVAFKGKGEGPCVAFSAHTDTVPPIGWARAPFKAEVENGRLYGLGSCDMKGPLATAIVVARALPEDQPIMLLLSCDEETTKEGARRIVAGSQLLRRHMPAGIVVLEPTELSCVRGHRVDIQFTADAQGIQAHSAMSHGVNANINLIPFLEDMRALHLRLRSDSKLQDAAYHPTWCDLNIIVDNYGVAPNITVGKATCRMKLRYSKSIAPDWIVDTIEASAKRHNIELIIRPEGNPPELPAEHPLIKTASKVSNTKPGVVSFGTDASQLSTVAPCVIMGPGSMEQAHKPDEFIEIAQMVAAAPLLIRLVETYCADFVESLDGNADT